MNCCNNIILYIALGDRYINQAIFSLTSLSNSYQGTCGNFTVKIFTDKPESFDWLSKLFSLETVCVSQEQLKQWSGLNSQILRGKIKAIQEVIYSSSVNLLFVDTDTFFLGKVDGLFEKISSGYFVMHLREWPFSHGRKMDSSFCPKDSEYLLESGLKISLNDESVMWNSGVIGISSCCKNILDDVLEFNDRFYKENPSWHVEQLSFSVVFQNSGKLVKAKNRIYHYWHNKEVVDPYIQNLQSLHADQVNSVLSKARRDRWKLQAILLYKYHSLQLKKFIRGLPYTYKVYLLFKPILKRGKH
jgi:hypothetical protein